MDIKDLKKILAELSIAGLLAGFSFAPIGCTAQETTTAPETEQAPAPSGTMEEEEAPAPGS